MSFIDFTRHSVHESHIAPAYGSLISDHADELEVSIVMPCLDEAEAIEMCVAEALGALAKAGLTGEVIVVDNGSTDGSPELAASAGARVVHERIRGYGSACRRGLAEARGRFLILGDADGTYDFTALPGFVEPLRNGADMVLGNRLNSSMEQGAMPWMHRHVGNPFLTWALNRLFSSRIQDAHCGLRSIKVASYRRLDLTSPGMEFASEFLVEALRHNVRIDQVPITYRRRSGGQPKLRTYRDGFRHVNLLVSMWANQRSRSEGRRSLSRKRDIDADRLRI
jgi:glycosyltransferase involved in cell wall biosynthesis